ncbi:MAG: hypothetical protein AB7O92_26780 [Acidimicrobiia bacterium]
MLVLAEPAPAAPVVVGGSAVVDVVVDVDATVDHGRSGNVDELEVLEVDGSGATVVEVASGIELVAAGSLIEVVVSSGGAVVVVVVTTTTSTGPEPLLEPMPVRDGASGSGRTTL